MAALSKILCPQRMPPTQGKVQFKHLLTGRLEAGGQTKPCSRYRIV